MDWTVDASSPVRKPHKKGRILELEVFLFPEGTRVWRIMPQFLWLTAHFFSISEGLGVCLNCEWWLMSQLCVWHTPLVTKFTHWASVENPHVAWKLLAPSAYNWDHMRPSISLPCPVTSDKRTKRSSLPWKFERYVLGFWKVSLGFYLHTFISSYNFYLNISLHTEHCPGTLCYDHFPQDSEAIFWKAAKRVKSASPQSKSYPGQIVPWARKLHEQHNMDTNLSGAKRLFWQVTLKTCV